METKKIIWICFMFLMGLISCDDMNSIQQKYADIPEKIYLGRTDSLTAFPGKERIKLSWYISADPKIQKTVIYWNQRKDSIVKPFVRTNPGIQKDSLIINNLLGTYTFELLNKNSLGDQSLVSSTTGTAYGDDYINGLRNRSISTFTVKSYSSVTKSDTVTIEWGTANLLCVFTKLSYKKRTTGAQVNLIVNSGDKTTILPDVGNRFGDPNDMINISSLFVPAIGAIDTFPAPITSAQMSLYTAIGSRLEYSAAGALTSTNPYTAQVKAITRVTDNIVYCDRVAAYASNLATTLLRLMINPDNTVSISGYYSGLTNFISNDTAASTFNPTTKTFVLKYKVVMTDGTYKIISETLTLQ